MSSPSVGGPTGPRGANHSHRVDPLHRSLNKVQNAIRKPMQFVQQGNQQQRTTTFTFRDARSIVPGRGAPRIAAAQRAISRIAIS